MSLVRSFTVGALIGQPDPAGSVTDPALYGLLASRYSSWYQGTRGHYGVQKGCFANTGRVNGGQSPFARYEEAVARRIQRLRAAYTKATQAGLVAVDRLDGE